MFLRHQLARLCAPEGDTDNPGGGGADPAKPDQPKVLTEEDIGRIANAAFTSQLKRLNIDGKITEAIGGLKLDEKFTTFAETIKASLGQQPKPDPKDPQKPSIDPELQRQIAKMAEDLDKEKAARLAAVQESESIKRSHEFGNARQRLYESLKPHASETLHDVWVDHLIHHKRMKVEDGIPLLEVEFAPVKGMPKQKEYLPLEEAIPHLVASDEAKRFQPVPDAGDGKGSPGPRGRRGSAPTLDSKDPMTRVAARLESLGLNFDNEFSS